MKAAVLYKYGAPLVIEDIEYGRPRQGEVLVRLVASGVCHTDLHVALGQFEGFPLPLVLGHEAAGVVEETGRDVSTVATGDHVVLSWIPQCGRCRYCTIGRPNLCTDRVMPAGPMGDGTTRFHKGDTDIYHFASVSSFSQYTVVPQEACIAIRKDAPLDKMCLMGCAVMTGVGAAINTARVRPGANVLVIGCGGIGLNVVQGSALAGAHQIIAVDIAEDKLTLARQFGATHTIDGAREDVTERVRQLTDRLGVDYSFEAISTVPTIQQAFESLAPGGICVVVGVAPPGSEIPIATRTLSRERAIMGCVYGSARTRVDIPNLVNMYMDGRIKLDELVSQTLPLERINEAFEDLRAGKVARSIIALQ